MFVVVVVVVVIVVAVVDVVAVVSFKVGLFSEATSVINFNEKTTPSPTD